MSESEQPQDPNYTVWESEGSYLCDSCGEEIVIPLDPSAGESQRYVEDCPVCCSPNVIHVQWSEANVTVGSEPEQDRFS